MKRNGSNRAMMSSKTRIPKGWRLVRLGDVAEVNRSNRDPADNSSSSFLYLDLTAVTAPGCLASPRQLAAADAPSRARRQVQSGDVLISTVRPNLRGFARVLEAPGNLVASTGFAVLSPRAIVSGSFVYHNIMTDEFAQYLENATTGQAYPAVRPSDVANYAFPLPPLPDQRAIAAVLDSIDGAIERTEAVIAATGQLRDSLLHELLTRGVPGWHTEWKEAPGLGTIPAGWEVVRLGDVAEVERGKFAHRPRNEPRFYGGSIPFIQTGDVVRANGKINQHSQTLNKLGLSISRLFPAGTIIITIAANIGETAIASYPVAFPDSLVGVTPYGIDTNFLEYFLRTQKLRLNQFAPESAQKNINLEDLRPLSAPLPPLPEQQAIAAVLDGVDGAIEKAKTGTNMLKSLKEATAEALLTGRVRVEATQT